MENEIIKFLDTIATLLGKQAKINEEFLARIRRLENAMAGFAEDGNGDLYQDEMEREARQTLQDMSIPPDKR